MGLDTTILDFLMLSFKPVFFHKSEKDGLKLNIQKTKTMASGPITLLVNK